MVEMTTTSNRRKGSSQCCSVLFTLRRCVDMAFGTLLFRWKIRFEKCACRSFVNVPETSMCEELLVMPSEKAVMFVSTPFRQLGLDKHISRNL